MIDYQEGNLDGKTGFKPIDSFLGSAQKNTQIVGKVIAGTAMDLIGVGIGATIDGISWMIPNKIEDPILFDINLANKKANPQKTANTLGSIMTANGIRNT